jgi:hypothetical protein
MALGASLLAGTPHAAGAKAPPTVRFIYERAASAGDCPDADVILDAVRARLGADPFHEPAEITIRASVARQRDELRAVLLLSDGSARGGERRLVSRQADCSELASAMELALSIAIDPLSVMREAPPVSPTALPAAGPPGPIAPRAPAAASDSARPPPAPLAPPPPSVSVLAPPPRPSPPRSLQVNLGAAGNWGASVAATAGFLAGVGLRSEGWSISVEGRADLPRSRPVDGGSISAATLAGTLAPCLHRGVFGGCLLATVAALRGSGQGLQNSQEATTTLYAVGARALVELPSGSAVALRLHLDLQSPLVRTTLRVGGEPVWTAPPLSIALGLGAVVRFR